MIDGRWASSRAISPSLGAVAAAGGGGMKTELLAAEDVVEELPVPLPPSGKF